uniref:Uncharacterized protein n=1 Tax=Romanomermis culicivorax TaxID=13658 RepID=A0A915J0V0_ROMCU
MQQTLSPLPTNTSAQGHGLPTSDPDNACCRSGFGTNSVVGLATTTKISNVVNVNLSTMPKTTGVVSVVASYPPTEGTPAPLARFIA